MSLLDRIIDSLHALFYNKRRSVSLGSRFVAVTAALITVTTVFPTLAEDLVPPAEVVESSAPQTEPVVESSAEPVASQSEPDAAPTPSESPTPLTEEELKAEEERKAEEAKVKVAPVQPRINFRFPNSIALDPRASMANLPQVAVLGGSMGLLCLSSNGVIDIYSKGFSNNTAVVQRVTQSESDATSKSDVAPPKPDKGALQVAGDLTNFVRISGSLYQINELINGMGGLRVMAAQGRAVSSNVTARYVELTGSDTSPEFCTKAANQRTIKFRALGLQMETVKTRVDFNKPSGK